jgi:xylulokinase
VLAIDLGTGGPKVALVAVDGTTLAWSSVAVETRLLPNGGAEQDPEAMWRGVVDAARRTLDACRPAPPIAAWPSRAST